MLTRGCRHAASSLRSDEIRDLYLLKGLYRLPCVHVQVCVFAFDCLFINGRSLLKESLEVRRTVHAFSLPSTHLNPPPAPSLGIPPCPPFPGEGAARGSVRGAAGGRGGDAVCDGKDEQGRGRAAGVKGGGRGSEHSCRRKEADHPLHAWFP